MKISVTIDISRKSEEVFPWIENPDKARLWQKNVKEEQIIKVTPEKTGTTFVEVIEENGNRLEIEGTVTNYIKNKLIAFHLKSKIHKVDVSYSVIDKEDYSTVVVDSKIIWKFPMNIMCFFIGNKIKANILRQTKSEFSELKRFCEIY